MATMTKTKAIADPAILRITPADCKTIGERLAELRQEATGLKEYLELVETPDDADECWDDDRDTAVSMLEELAGLSDPPKNIASTMVTFERKRWDDELDNSKEIGDELREIDQALNSKGKWAREYEELMGWVYDLV
jgi:hypothetical protein